MGAGGSLVESLNGDGTIGMVESGNQFRQGVNGISYAPAIRPVTIHERPAFSNSANIDRLKELLILCSVLSVHDELRMLPLL